jgi:hypothetical protein
MKKLITEGALDLVFRSAQANLLLAGFWWPWLFAAESAKLAESPQNLGERYDTRPLIEV